MTNAPGEQNESTPRGPLARRSFRVLAVVSLLVGALVLASFLLPRSASEPSKFDPETAQAAAAQPMLPAIADITDEERENLPPSVKHYLESTVYPPGTGRLHPGIHDLLHPNSRHEEFRKVLDTFSTDPDEVVSVRLTADRFFYTDDENIHLDLKVRRGSNPIKPISIQAHAIREGRAGEQGDPIAIRFHPEGDGLVAELDSAHFADHFGSLVVKARIQYAQDAYYDEVLRFFYTPSNKIPARFTGEFRDSLAGGSLEIEVGLNVDQSGFYRIDANLYDRFGNPISFSAFKGRLNSGKRFARIQFFGRLLREVGANGPFRVGEIRGYRFLDGEYPDRERIPDFVGNHLTSAYRANGFSNDEFTSDHKQQMVALLIEDVARGISIEPPPNATAINQADKPSLGRTDDH